MTQEPPHMLLPHHRLHPSSIMCRLVFARLCVCARPLQTLLPVLCLFPAEKRVCSFDDGF